MRFSKHGAYLVLAASLVSVGGCGDMLQDAVDSVFAPDPIQHRAYGQVFDDTALLMPSRALERGVMGVKVEIASGPVTGRYVITDAYGQYDLGAVTPGTLLRASKDGWSTVVEAMGPTGDTPHFYLGQAPHVLWGMVGTSGPPWAPDGIRAEIIDGPNAGTVAVSSAMGEYSFENLSTQPSFQIEFSKPGYQTARVQAGPLNSNRQLERILLQSQ